MRGNVWEGWGGRGKLKEGCKVGTVGRGVGGAKGWVYKVGGTLYLTLQQCFDLVDRAMLFHTSSNFLAVP